MTQEVVTETTEAPPPAPEQETPPAEAPAEQPPAEPETPEQTAAREQEERRAARIERATAAEKAAAEAREIRRAERAREEAKQLREQARRDREAYEAKQKEDAEAIRAGGLKALKARGLEYSELTKEWINQSSPEAQERARIAKMLEEQQKEIAQFKESQQRAMVEQSFKQLETLLEDKAEEYPHAYAMSNRMFRAAVPAIAQSLINQGRQPTQSAVLKLLDEAEKAEHDERENRRAALQKRSKLPSNGVTPQTSSPNASRAVRTLTSQDGSERARERGQKTAAELDEEILANLKQMMRGT